MTFRSWRDERTQQAEIPRSLKQLCAANAVTIEQLRLPMHPHVDPFQSLSYQLLSDTAGQVGTAPSNISRFQASN
jgi:hypothetical protein